MYFIKTPALLMNLYNGLHWRIPVEDNRVFLTFDDGPHPESTPIILDILAEYKAKATFFCLGENVEKYADNFSAIKKAGHTIGNHAYTHISGWETDNNSYFYNVNKGANVINNNLFRPPYGRMKKGQMKFLMRQYEIYMWDVVSGDFDPKVSAEKCYKNVVKNYKSGSIILFHDNLKSISKLENCLPKILEFFNDKGVKMSPIAKQLQSKPNLDHKAGEIHYN